MPDTPSSPGEVTQRALIRHLLSDGKVWRSASLLAAGVQAQAIADALEAGVINRVAPGAYHLASATAPSSLVAVAAACSRAPRSVICLTTAAYLCGLLDDAPTTTWVALPAGARVPKRGSTNEQVVHWSYRGAFEVGLDTGEICGVEVRWTGPARTVVDLLRYARYVGGEDTARRVGQRFLERGGKPSTILATASALATPAKTLRSLDAVVSEWHAAKAC
jgi:predicted transcriptional regulator of viral defense system